MTLILLYYLSQNPNFPESVKPIMCKLKDSEEMLKFLNDLSKFSEMFALFQKSPCENPPPPKNAPPKDAPKGKAPPFEEEKKNDPPPEEKEKPQSPTSGIADKFIEECLERYFKKR